MIMMNVLEGHLVKNENENRPGMTGDKRWVAIA